MPIVQTRLGTIEGVEHPGAVSFLGIPYAAAPVGARRWLPPTPPTPWSGTLDATKHPNRAYQVPFPEELAPPGGIPGELNEDMLYLNVHTPSADGGRRPVMFYIHGGGYTVGSANDFDPWPFAAANDIVVVCINYRLGMFGFLDLSRFGTEYAGSANLGFQDQIAALKWTRDNIGDYGGDPDSVTLCGCSAGGGSIMALLSAPGARGLFHRGIAMSPIAVAPEPPDVVTPSAAALKMSEENFLLHLRSLSAEALFEFQTMAGGGGPGVDGIVLAAGLDDAIRTGVNPVPLLTGCTQAEGPFLTQGVQRALGNDPGILLVIEAGLTTNIGGGDAGRYVTYLESVTAGGTPEQRMDRVWLDAFRSTAVRAAQALGTRGENAWLYTFAVPTDHEFGPTHGGDVPFAFGSIDTRAEGEMYAFYRNNAANRRLAGLWSRTFARFTRTGDPNGEDMPDWPTYSADRRTCLVLGTEPTVVDNPDGNEALAAYGLI